MRSLLPALLPVFFASVVGCADQTSDLPRPSPSTPLESSDGEGQGASSDPNATDGPSTPPTTDDGNDTAPATLRCTVHRGDAITPEFGRLDGTIRAVIVPGDTKCAGGDDDHVIVQIDAAGETYGIAINVESTRASSPLVRSFEKSAPLEGPVWSSGWHTSVSLDYAYDLGVHATSFVAEPKADLSATIASRLVVGAKVSVFGQGYTTGDGAHDIHRTKGGHDGALVVDPTGSPSYVLFAFADQSF